MSLCGNSCDSCLLLLWCKALVSWVLCLHFLLPIKKDCGFNPRKVLTPSNINKPVASSHSHGSCSAKKTPVQAKSRRHQIHHLRSPCRYVHRMIRMDFPSNLESSKLLGASSEKLFVWCICYRIGQRFQGPRTSSPLFSCTESTVNRFPRRCSSRKFVNH